MSHPGFVPRKMPRVISSSRSEKAASGCIHFRQPTCKIAALALIPRKDGKMPSLSPHFGKQSTPVTSLIRIGDEVNGEKKINLGNGPARSNRFCRCLHPIIHPPFTRMMRTMVAASRLPICPAAQPRCSSMRACMRRSVSWCNE